MRVLSAPKRLHALSGYGLEVVEYVDGERPSGETTRRATS
jgi:3,4-dihydroxy 2-butanone 4-phosphate synthase/GTP cyclohydrolase II